MHIPLPAKDPGIPPRRLVLLCCMWHHRRIMKHRLLTCLILAAAASCSEPPPAQRAAPENLPDQSQSTESPVADESARIDIGDIAPSFTLKDQTGTERGLDHMLADGNVALIFYRSADW